MAAFTPDANAVLVVIVVASDTVAAGSMTGGSLTWTKATSALFDGTGTVYLFWALTGASPGSTTITFDCTGDNASGCVLMAFSATGTDLTTPVRQSKARTATAANPNLTLDAAMLPTGGYIAGFGMSRNPPVSAPPASWTEIADTGYANNTTGASGAYRAEGETGTTIAFTSASAAFGIVAVELKTVPPLSANVSQPVFALYPEHVSY